MNSDTGNGDVGAAVASSAIVRRVVWRGVGQLANTVSILGAHGNRRSAKMRRAIRLCQDAADALRATNEYKAARPLSPNDKLRHSAPAEDSDNTKNA